MDILTSRTKALLFDVCCEAIDQNFVCGCRSLHYQPGLRRFALINGSKPKKIAIQKIWNYCLKLSATEKYAYFLGYLHFTLRYGFPKLNNTVPFLYKKRLKQKTGKNVLEVNVLTSRTGKRNQSTSI